MKILCSIRTLFWLMLWGLAIGILIGMVLIRA
jgi:hypothetical protein